MRYVVGIKPFTFEDMGLSFLQQQKRKKGAIVKEEREKYVQHTFVIRGVEEKPQ